MDDPFKIIEPQCTECVHNFIDALYKNLKDITSATELYQKNLLELLKVPDKS